MKVANQQDTLFITSLKIVNLLKLSNHAFNLYMLLFYESFPFCVAIVIGRHSFVARSSRLSTCDWYSVNTELNTEYLESRPK